MSLVTNVQARCSVKLLRDLTNPQDSTASSVDTTRLGLAATDVEAEFKIYAGVAYDDSVATHVTIGVEGVIAKLRVYLGQTKADEQFEAWTKRLRDLGKITGNDRIIPVSTSEVEPSSEAIDGETVRPWADLGVFDHITPNPPRGSSDLPVSDDN